jgi:hypothetical protein
MQMLRTVVILSVLTLQLISGSEDTIPGPLLDTPRRLSLDSFAPFYRHPPLWVITNAEDAEDFFGQLPELLVMDRAIRLHSRGESNLVRAYEYRTGPKDTDTDPMDCWEFYVGEELPGRTGRLYSFFIKDCGQVLVGSTIGPWDDFAEWREKSYPAWVKYSKQ